MGYTQKLTQKPIPEYEREFGRTIQIKSSIYKELDIYNPKIKDSLSRQIEYPECSTEKATVILKTKEGLKYYQGTGPAEQLITDNSTAIKYIGIPTLDVLDEGDCFFVQHFSDSFFTTHIRNGMVPSPETEFMFSSEHKDESRIEKVKTKEISTGGPTIRNDSYDYITLDTINDLCSLLYSDKEKKIVVVVLARYELDKVKRIIRNHYTHWHNATGEGVDFFWLGYGHNKNPGNKVEDGSDISKSIKFNDALYQKDVEMLTKFDFFKYRDRVALLLFDCNYGKLRYENYLYFDIEKLAQPEDDSKLKTFFSHLIESCKRKNQIADIDVELRVRYLLSCFGNINIVSIIGFLGSVFGIVEFIFK